MGKVLAIANQKGGVGKTTTSINLAASLAASEKTTLLLDCDPQANCTSGLGHNPRELEKSIYEVLVDDSEIADILLRTDLPYLDIAPSHINLVGAEIEMVDLPEREQVLRKKIVKERAKYDYTIIDCPPSLGLLTLNALSAADAVLIPVQCEYFALEGLGQLFNTIKLVREHLNPDLKIAGVVLTMYDSRLRLSRQVYEEVKRYFGEKVFDTVIQRNVKISEAPSYGKPIIMYDATSTGARNYMSLASELLKRDSPKRLDDSEPDPSTPQNN